MCINKDFAHVKTPYLVWNPNELACCGSPKEVPVAPSGSLIQMTVKIIVTRCQCLQGGFFCEIFSRIIIFSMELYYGDQLCSKCMKKSFVRYLVNEIQAYKYNILMTLQNAIATTVTVIAQILLCIVVRLLIGLPPAPWSCLLYFCICEYFEKLTKLVT